MRYKFEAFLIVVCITLFIFLSIATPHNYNQRLERFNDNNVSESIILDNNYFFPEYSNLESKYYPNMDITIYSANITANITPLIRIQFGESYTGFKITNFQNSSIYYKLYLDIRNISHSNMTGYSSWNPDGFITTVFIRFSYLRFEFYYVEYLELLFGEK